jgi:hypothetical protein
VKTATKRAMRKNQYRTLSQNARPSYMREIEMLRNKIRSMLYYAQSPA